MFKHKILSGGVPTMLAQEEEAMYVAFFFHNERLKQLAGM